MNSQDYSTYTYVTAVATAGLAGVTTSVSTDPCVLKSIVVNNGPATTASEYTVGIIDNSSGSTVNVGKITVNSVNDCGTYIYNAQLTTGLRINLTCLGKKASTVPNITVITRR